MIGCSASVTILLALWLATVGVAWWRWAALQDDMRQLDASLDNVGGWCRFWQNRAHERLKEIDALKARIAKLEAKAAKGEKRKR